MHTSDHASKELYKSANKTLNFIFENILTRYFRFRLSFSLFDLTFSHSFPSN